MSKESTNKWSGEYISVNGYRGKVALEFGDDNDRLEGKFSIDIKFRDHQQHISGYVSGKKSKETYDLEIKLDKQESMQMRAKVVDGGSYAKHAMYGVTESNTQKSWIGEGVWMLWNFENHKKE